MQSGVAYAKKLLLLKSWKNADNMGVWEQSIGIFEKLWRMEKIWKKI